MQEQDPRYKRLNTFEINRIQRTIFKCDNIEQLYNFKYNLARAYYQDVIYIIDSEYSKDIKIGIASDVYRRLTQLQHASGKFFKRIFVTTPSIHSKQIEKELHQHFKNQKHTGEWYYLEAEDVLKVLQDKYGYKGANYEI